MADTQPTGKQFGSYIQSIMDSINSFPTEGGMVDLQDVEAGLREVCGNADAVYWAAQEAFIAGHRACLDVTVPALFQDPTHKPDPYCLWEQYTPSDAVIDQVQAMGN